jgi:hypothetical protein
MIVIWILRLDAYPVRSRRLHAALWIGFFPFYLEQWMGQFSFLMAAFLWILMRDGMPDRPVLAREGRLPGRSFRAWVASVGLKSYTALFAISYLRRRQIRPVLLCAGIVVLACAPYYIARPEDLKQFLLLNFRPLPPGVHGGTLGTSALIRMLGWCLPETISGRLLDFRIFDVYVGNVPALGVSALVVMATLWATLVRGRRSPINLQIALWILAFFLVFKDIWEYHYVMLLPVVTAIGLGTGSRLLLWMGLLLALPTPYVLFAQDGSLSLGADILHHASKAVPTFVLFGWVLLRTVRPGLRRSTTAHDLTASP